MEHPEVEFIPLNQRTEENADEARALCLPIPLPGRCLAYALAGATLLGIWAGTTTAERRELRRRRAA